MTQFRASLALLRAIWDAKGRLDRNQAIAATKSEDVNELIKFVVCVLFVCFMGCRQRQGRKFRF